MKIQLKQRCLSKVFMGLMVTSSLFHGVKAAGTHFDSSLSNEALYCQNGKSLCKDAVKDIASRISDYKGILEEIRDRDIVVLLGNTGSGKTTTIIILGGNRLIINKFQALERTPGEEGFQIKFGSESETKYPEYIRSDNLGIVFDMPGFEDTEGAENDIVNAALIKYLLENARSVSAIVTVSAEEFGGGRAKGFKTVLQYIRMFSKDFLNESVGFLVTKVNPSILNDINIFYQWIKEFSKTENKQVDLWLEKKRFFGVPAVSQSDDVSKYISDNKRALESHITEIPKRSTGTVNVSMTLSPKISSDLERYFQDQIDEQLRASLENDWLKMVEEFGGTSQQFTAEKEKVFERFIKKLENSKEIMLFKPFGSQQYSKALFDFKQKRKYDDKFNLFTNELEKKEYKEAIKAAEARATELAAMRVRHQRRIDENRDLGITNPSPFFEKFLRQTVYMD